jgi:hypothetical protein
MVVMVGEARLFQHRVGQARIGDAIGARIEQPMRCKGTKSDSAVMVKSDSTAPPRTAHHVGIGLQSYHRRRTGSGSRRCCPGPDGQAATPPGRRHQPWLRYRVAARAVRRTAPIVARARSEEPVRPPILMASRPCRSMPNYSRRGRSARRSTSAGTARRSTTRGHAVGQREGHHPFDRRRVGQCHGGRHHGCPSARRTVR